MSESAITDQAQAVVQLLGDARSADDGDFVVLPRTAACQAAYVLGLTVATILRLQAEVDAARAAAQPVRRRRRAMPGGKA